MHLPFCAMVDEPVPISQAFWDDWRALSMYAVAANVFTAPFWLQCHWQTYASAQAQLRPARYVDGTGRTVAMSLHQEVVCRHYGLPCRVWRTLDFNAQRIPAVLAPDLPTMASALVALYTKHASRIDQFEFYKLDSLDQQLHTLQAWIALTGIDSTLSVFNLQPQIVLPESWDDYTRGRQTFRNKRRNLTNRIARELGDLQFSRWRACDAPRPTLSRLWDDVLDVFDASWQGGVERARGTNASARWRTHWTEIVCAAADAGLADVNVMYIDRKPVAFDFNLCERNTVYMILGGFVQHLAAYDLGKLLLVHWLHDSHQRGEHMIEFGGEHLAYKWQWTHRTLPAYQLRILGQTRQARIARYLGR